MASLEFYKLQEPVTLRQVITRQPVCLRGQAGAGLYYRLTVRRVILYLCSEARDLNLSALSCIEKVQLSAVGRSVVEAAQYSR